MEWRVDWSNIAMYDRLLYSLRIVTPNVAFRAIMVKIVKGSIDCSVLFCNVTRVLTLSVTLDTWCIMSVAQTRKWLQKIWQVCSWKIILDYSTRHSIFTGGWRHLSFKVLCLFVCMLVCLLVCLALNSNSNTLE